MKGKKEVKNKLRDPDSAKFRDVFLNRGEGANNLPITCGEVSSNDGLGTGYQKFISDGSSSTTYLEEEVDGDFNDLWDLFCGSPSVSYELKRR